MQALPPLLGLGLSHCLVRVCFPSSQVFEQAPHDDHIPQLPSTGAMEVSETSSLYGV